MVSFPIFLYRVISHILISMGTAMACCIAVGRKITWKNFLCCTGILGGILVVNLFFLTPDSPMKFLFAIAGTLICYYFVFKLKGMLLLLQSFILLLVEFAADISMGIVFSALFDSQTIATMRHMTSPLTILLQGSSGLAMALFALIYRGLLHLFKRVKKAKINTLIGYLLRPLMMLTTTCLIFARSLIHLTTSDEIERFRLLLPDFLLMLLLLAIGITYVLQDIRTYHQAQENKTLLHQQSLQSLLLQDTRVFRHNISNMLYGFQGTLLSGDMKAIEEYYQSMVASCQMINNENVVALKRLPSAAMSTLLLNKIHQANDLKIPFYASVEENIHWFGLKDEEMCQVLGVLLDNALEATRQSQAPMVSFRAANENGALSILISNTYSSDTAPCFCKSTKENHEGLGLQSVRELLKKRSNVLFNIFTKGRYVEASLMLYK